MPVPLDETPRIVCRRAAFGEVMANAADAPWREIAPAGFVEAESAGALQQGTEVRTAWSAEELRVLFIVEDAHPWATHATHDAPLYEEEVVEVFLDPVGDLESYFELEVNPLNAVLDLVLRKNRSGYLKNLAWHCAGLRTAVSRSVHGWSAELAIPFRSLVAELPTAGSRWRVNFCRIDRPVGQARELSAWSPTGRPTFHVPARFGVLEFVD